MDDRIRERLTQARHLLHDAAKALEGAAFTEPGSFEAADRVTLIWRGPSGRHLTLHVFADELSYAARNETGFLVAGGALADPAKAQALWGWLHLRTSGVG